MKKLFYISWLFISILLNSQQLIAQTLITDSVEVGTYDDAINLLFGAIPKSHYENGFLIEKSGYDYKFQEASGTLTDSVINMISWYFFYEKFRFAQSDSSLAYKFTQIDSLKNKYIDANNVLPFGVLDYNYFKFKDSCITNGSLVMNNHRFVENTSDLGKIYTKLKLFCVSPLNIDVNTLNPQFIILPNLVFTNNTHSVIKIRVDCDDALGFKEVFINQVFQASYASTGYKNLITQFIYDNGDTLYSNSQLFCNDPNYLNTIARTTSTGYDFTFDVASWPDTYPSEFVNVPYEYKVATCGVWQGCNTSQGNIRKPIIVFSGYNPTNGKDLVDNGNPGWENDLLGPAFSLAGWRGPLYETFNGFYIDLSFGPDHFGRNGSELFGKLRKEGYDIIIVKMEDGIGYMQRYAHIVTQVIKKVNELKITGNSNRNPDAGIDPESGPTVSNPNGLRQAHHENIVIGYSAGALSTRMGLLIMEYQHAKYRWTPNAWKYPHHNTKIWVAYDCESQGSNTPIGLQMMWDYLGNPNNPPISFADISHTLISYLTLGILKKNGVATQNTLYHINKLFSTGGSVNNNKPWDVDHDTDFDGYFQDLTTLSLTNPHNLSGYPLNVRRIGISQGNANGIHNKITSSDMIKYEAMSNPCFSPLGGAMNLNPLINPTVLFDQVQIRGFRKAEAYFITQPGNQATFYCRNGTAIKAIFWNLQINYAHTKYDIFNYVKNAQDYDVTAASMLYSHILFGNKLPYSSTSLTTASFGYCVFAPFDKNMHGFCPTPSGLDIHAPGDNHLPRLPNLNFSPTNQNLLFQNDYTGPGSDNQSPNHNFGYPHIKHPTDHYDITPYDAVCANGDFDQTHYQENAIHTEDPNPYTADYLVEELAPTTLYLSNRTVHDETTGEKYYADFEARNSILAGNQDIYKHYGVGNYYQRLQTSPGDFILENNAVVTMRANNGDGVSSIVLGAGFSAKAGSLFRAYVYGDAYCAPFSWSDRMASPASNTPPPQIPARSMLAKRASSTKLKESMPKISVVNYPNPTTGSIFYELRAGDSYTYSINDLTGRVLETGTISTATNQINLSTFKAGIYLISIKNNNYIQTDRIILQ